MAVKSAGRKPAPEAELRSFIESARFDPKDQKLMLSVRTAVRKLFPAANELAYNYNHAVVIAYSPSENGIEGIVSISLLAEGVRLYFTNGPKLPDPKRLLQGSAKMVRFIQLKSASDLAHPDVKALIDAAIDVASAPLPPRGKGSLIIKSGATKARGKPKKKK